VLLLRSPCSLAWQSALAIDKLPFPFVVDALPANSFVKAVVGSSTISGRPSVVDRDTIDIRGERIRHRCTGIGPTLPGCERTELSVRTISANALDRFLDKSQPVRCDFVERDQYGRFVGNCYRADNVNIAASLVRSGLALDWLRYSNGFYAKEQEAAKAERTGVWQGNFELPWEWRAQKRGPDIQKQAAAVLPCLAQAHHRAATSRATSTTRASAFITCRVNGTTTRPRSAKARANDGFVRNRKRVQQVGARPGGSVIDESVSQAACG
jgi:endonuclease YncB( thermonuclease family)